MISSKIVYLKDSTFKVRFLLPNPQQFTSTGTMGSKDKRNPAAQRAKIVQNDFSLTN